jgi:hypothetical protein
MPLLRINSTGVTIAKATAYTRTDVARAGWRPLQGVWSISFLSSVVAIVRKRDRSNLSLQRDNHRVLEKGEPCPSVEERNIASVKVE